MEYSHYTSFMYKFVINMEKFKQCNLSLDVKNTHVFNSLEENILTQHECQEWASKFEEKARQNIAGMMELYEKSIYDVQRYIQCPEINFGDEYPVSFAFFQEL